MANEKHFPKTISQKNFSYALFTKVPGIIAFRNFSPSLFKLKSGILPHLNTLNWRLLFILIQVRNLTTPLSSNSSRLICNDKISHYLGLIPWILLKTVSSDHSRMTRVQGKMEGISLTPHYYFQRATVES